MLMWKNVFIFLAIIAIFIFGFAFLYEQCQKDGYSKTQCMALLNSNNRMSFVVLDK